MTCCMPFFFWGTAISYFGERTFAKICCVSSRGIASTSILYWQAPFSGPRATPLPICPSFSSLPLKAPFSIKWRFLALWMVDISTVQGRLLSDLLQVLFTKKGRLPGNFARLASQSFLDLKIKFYPSGILQEKLIHPKSDISAIDYNIGTI